MAGSGTVVKRQWGISNGNYYDPWKALVDQHNLVVDDLETIRAALQTIVDANLDGAGSVVSALPVIAEGTTSKKEVKITNGFTIMVQGVPVTVAAQEVGFTATTHDIADPDADPREILYTLSTDSQGNVTITAGAIAAASAAAYPDVPAGEVVFGSVLIQHDGTAIFNATTDDLDASHLTVTYADVAQVVVSDLAAGSLTAGDITTQESGD